MDWTLADVLFATTLALCATLGFTVWRFRGGAAHDNATNKLLRRFFYGKTCAVCKQPIPPVHRMGLKPGLLNPATHETHSWNEIPNANLATVLETELPLCSTCEMTESFRQRYPNLVVDDDRSVQGAQPREQTASE